MIGFSDYTPAKGIEMIRSSAGLVGSASLRRKLTGMTLSKTSPSVRVGIVKTAKYPKELRGGGVLKNPPTVAAVAYVNEFGTKKIPSRPFMRNSIDVYLKDIRVKLLLRAIITVENPVLNLQSAKLLGNLFVGIMREQVLNPLFPRNAPTTVMIKTRGKGGKTTPLIDTGLLRRSIDFEIDR